jgi:hypothetical protein
VRDCGANRLPKRVDASLRGDAAAANAAHSMQIGAPTPVQRGTRGDSMNSTVSPVAANRRQIVSTLGVGLLTTRAMESADDRTRCVASDVVRRS